MRFFHQAIVEWKEKLSLSRSSGHRFQTRVRLTGNASKLAVLMIGMWAGAAFCGSTSQRAPPARSVELQPKLIRQEGIYGVEYLAGKEVIGSAAPSAPAGIEVLLPGGTPRPLEFRKKTDLKNGIELGPLTEGSLTFRLQIQRMSPTLVRRTLVVSATQPQRFAVTFSFFPAIAGTYSSFTDPERKRILYDTLGEPAGPGKAQTFPVAAIEEGGRIFGILADTPAQWENRCLVLIDPDGQKLAVMNGDGREPHPLRIKDATDVYQYEMDGWQTIQPGESKSYVTWLFADRANSHYDVQLAAHLALANAKGWNRSSLEAILRNTSYLLLRRNLMRTEGRYLFISGTGYGWKQWVSDGFWLSQALGDPEKMIESYRSVFANRINYEDNAQYYLIWAAVAKRAGGQINHDLTRFAYDFIRQHETNGIYYPPQLKGTTRPNGFKTYMDQERYDDDDAPASDQGFQCGALLAAKELGFPVQEQDIAQAIAGYRSMYNTTGQFMPTSLKRRNVIGQDTLYGEALTFAVFGRELLTDEQVCGHMRTTFRIQTPYGMRIISQPDGALLPGNSGNYTFGGSWFLNDAANYLEAELHGMPSKKIDQCLVKRIQTELAYAPAFNESISTVTGKPYGHILYSWNSGYWWLRREFRKRLGQKGPDPVEIAIDHALGVARDRSGLHLSAVRENISPP